MEEEATPLETVITIAGGPFRSNLISERNHTNFANTK